jgi:biofilm PGA synthesis N-glycosyltransferase PgaC
MFSDTYTQLIISVSVLTILLSMLAVYSEYRKAKRKRLTLPLCKYKYDEVKTVAVLIASKNGEKTIDGAVNAAKANGVDVFVVSDGSTDKTAAIATEAGATVYKLRKNVGKPTALYKAYKHFKLKKHYDAIAILDDDVVIEDDFIQNAVAAMDRDCAITVGKNLTVWPKDRFWNVWLAARTYSYWAYQITLRNIQSNYNIMSCISGSNSLYRTKVLNKVLTKQTPYIVDDTFWTLETHRLKLGTIKYAPKAKAWLQDPTNYRDWYKQNLRWMWGTYQGILGHRIGTQANRFHLSYVALMLDWLLYIASGPVTLLVIWQAGLANLPLSILLLFVGYSIWISVAAVAMKMPRLLIFIPAIVLIDFIFRWVMIHGLIKAFRQRTVANCVWESPKRFETQAAASA